MRPSTSILHALPIGIVLWLMAPARAAQPTAPPRSSLSKDSAAKMPARTDSRTTLLVPLPVAPAWQDLAFLAAIPAMTVVSHGAPSLVALDAAGTLTPEIQDYLRRYRWAVRMADFDQLKGSMVNVIERLEYRVAYE